MKKRSFSLDLIEPFFIILLFFLLISSPVASQKMLEEIGPEIKIEAVVDFWGHLHSNPSGHFVMLMKDNSSIINREKIAAIVQKYDRKFNLVFSKEINIDNSDVKFGNMLYAKDKFIFCTQIKNKKEKKISCSVSMMSMSGILSAPIEVASIAYKEKRDEPKYLNWQVSEDTSKLLLATLADDDDNVLTSKVNIFVMDNNANKIWSRSISLPYTQAQFSCNSWMVANNGQVYMLAKVDDGHSSKGAKKENGKKKPAYKMIIFRFDAANEKANEYVLDLKGKFVVDGNFRIGPQNHLYCGGFYADDTKAVIQGVFFCRINDQTGTIEMATIKEFSDTDLANLDTKEDRSNNEGLDPKFVFNDIIPREDGGIVVVAEEAYQYTIMYPPGANIHMPDDTYVATGRKTTDWESISTFVNNEIVISSINPVGEIEWVRTIPKKQVFLNSKLYNGYASMVSGSNIYFLYNDTEYNLDRPLSDKAQGIFNFDDAVGTLVTIGDDGKVNREKAFDSKDDTRALLVASYSRQISPNELFLVTAMFKTLGKTRLRMGLVRVQ